MPKASIIIPTFNRLARLMSVIAALEKQTVLLDDFEVVVISDGSSDGTEAYLRGYTHPLDLKAYFQRNQGPAAARNLGIKQASGDIIIFLDDDVVPEPDLVHEHIQAQASADGLVIIGPMLTPSDARLSPWTQWEQDMLMKQYRAMEAGDWLPTARQFYTGNSSIARHHLIANGGFDTSFRRAEDVELAYRLEQAGLRFEFQPQAAGYHYAVRSYTAWTEIAYAYGHNDVIFHQLKGHEWVLPTLFQEFTQRHLWIRLSTRLCLDRAILSSLLNRLSKTIVAVSYPLSMRTLSKLACSVIFNLRYYQGVSDKLGGRRVFFQAVSQTIKTRETTPQNTQHLPRETKDKESAELG
jgi:glycosyltransferase involved in cell wall biosynthesis